MATAERDTERALEQMEALKHRIRELEAGQRRGGVNMEYLKNVVVQFMTFPSGSAEQRALVPVLATLLQFNRRDVRAPTGGLAHRSLTPAVPGRSGGPSTLPTSRGGAGPRPGSQGATSRRRRHFPSFEPRRPPRRRRSARRRGGGQQSRRLRGLPLARGLQIGGGNTRKVCTAPRSAHPTPSGRGKRFPGIGWVSADHVA